MTVISTVKKNPLVTVLVTLAAAAATFTGAWAGIGLIDDLHVTEAELLIYDLKAHTFASGQFSDLTLEIQKIETVGKCRWLKSEKRALEDAIYVRERDGALDGNGNPHGEYIRALKQDLKDLQEEYDVLGCALKLA